MYKKALLLLVFLATTLQLNVIFAYSKAEFVIVRSTLETNLNNVKSSYSDKCDSSLAKAYKKLNSCFKNACSRGSNSIIGASTAVYNFKYVVDSLDVNSTEDLLNKANIFYGIADSTIVDAQNIVAGIDYKNCNNNSYTTGDFGNPSNSNYSNSTYNNTSYNHIDNENSVSGDSYSEASYSTTNGVSFGIGYNPENVNSTEEIHDFEKTEDYNPTTSKAWYNPMTWFNTEAEQREIDNQDDKEDIVALKSRLNNLGDYMVTDPADQMINPDKYDEDGYRPATYDEIQTEKERIEGEIRSKQVQIDSRSTVITRNKNALGEYSSDLKKAQEEAGEAYVKKTQIDDLDQQIEDLETRIGRKEIINPDSITDDELKALAKLKGRKQEIEGSITPEEQKALDKISIAQTNLDHATEVVDDGGVLTTKAEREQAILKRKAAKTSAEIKEDARRAIEYNMSQQESQDQKATKQSQGVSGNEKSSVVNGGGNSIIIKDPVEEGRASVEARIKLSKLKQCNGTNNLCTKEEKEAYTKAKKIVDGYEFNSVSKAIVALNEAKKKPSYTQEQADKDKKEATKVVKKEVEIKYKKDLIKLKKEFDSKINNSNLSSEEKEALKKEYAKNVKALTVKRKSQLKEYSDPEKAKAYIQSKVNRNIKDAENDVIKAENDAYIKMIKSGDPKTKIKGVEGLANNKQLVANRAKSEAAKVCKKDNNSNECKKAKEEAKVAQVDADTAASNRDKNLARMELTPEKAESDPELAKKIANAAKKEAIKACASGPSDNCNKAKERAKNAEKTYEGTSSAKNDITTRVFTINVNKITPGMKVHGGTLEENVNFALGTIIQKLMIALGSLSILIMTVGAGYIVMHNGQDELLNKGKSIFMSGIYAMIVALSSYYLIVIVRYIMYH